MKMFKEHLGDDLFNAYKGTDLFTKELGEFSLKLAKQQLTEVYEVFLKELKEKHPDHVIDSSIFTSENFVEMVLLFAVSLKKGSIL